jgi:hypothetical protein
MNSMALMLMVLPLAILNLLCLIFTKQAILALLVQLDQLEQQVPLELQVQLDRKAYKEFKVIQVQQGQLVLLDLSEPLDRKE